MPRWRRATPLWPRRVATGLREGAHRLTADPYALTRRSTPSFTVDPGVPAGHPRPLPRARVMPGVGPCVGLPPRARVPPLPPRAALAAPWPVARPVIRPPPLGPRGPLVPTRGATAVPGAELARAAPPIPPSPPCEARAFSPEGPRPRDGPLRPTVRPVARRGPRAGAVVATWARLSVGVIAPRHRPGVSGPGACGAVGRRLCGFVPAPSGPARGSGAKCPRAARCKVGRPFGRAP